MIFPAGTSMKFILMWKYECFSRKVKKLTQEPYCKYLDFYIAIKNICQNLPVGAHINLVHKYTFYSV